MGLKSIDKVCQYVYSKMVIDRWVNLDEISEILKGYGLEKSEVTAALDFLKKHFLALDKNEQRTRFNLGFCNFYRKVLHCTS